MCDLWTSYYYVHSDLNSMIWTLLLESIGCPDSFATNVTLFSALYLLMAKHLDDQFYVLSI